MSPKALVSIVALLALGARARSEDFLVGPGEAWPHTLSTLAPGDRVYLASGAHRSQVLTGVKGTAEAPIQILSADPSQPATIIGGGVSLTLVECAHVSIGAMLLAAGETGGIHIRGSAEEPSPGIAIRGVVLARPGFRSGTGHGIWAQYVTDLTIDRVRIESWGDAAILLDHAHRVSIERTTAVAANQSQRGFIATGASSDLSIARAILESVTGPALGLTATKNVAIDGCVFAKCRRPIELGAIENLAITRSTIFEPVRCAVSFSAPASSITIAQNLILWKPGALETLVCGLDHATKLTLGPNLWWSLEMPEAMAVFGPLPGDAGERQIYDLDPVLDPRSLSPTIDPAKAFGHTASKPVSPASAESAPESDGDNPKGP